MIMVMLICTEMLSCPESYLLIRKQPLRPSSFYLSKKHFSSFRAQHLHESCIIRPFVCYSCRIWGDIAERKKKKCWNGRLSFIIWENQIWAAKKQLIGPWEVLQYTEQALEIWPKSIKFFSSPLQPKFLVYFLSCLSIGPFELRRSVEYRCSRTSSERQGETWISNSYTVSVQTETLYTAIQMI